MTKRESEKIEVANINILIQIQIQIHNHRRQCKEGDCKDREARGDNLAQPGSRYRVTVTNGGHCDLKAQ